MMSVPVQCRQETAPEILRHCRRSQMINPNPGERAERYLEGARPVDAALERILFEPALDLRADFEWVLFCSRQRIRLPQQNQVLVPVQLPYEFMVSHGGKIQIGNAPEVFG